MIMGAVRNPQSACEPQVERLLEAKAPSHGGPRQLEPGRVIVAVVA